ncbi:cyclic nucleotide-binding domain-containing protein [Erythrobacter crassostreae]|uniref:Cyclic nucleotide-binding domain-containing protein n=1 Tax=Erythrobacter crassostreae TaxID=2828328 RepID=A0A9X1JLY0_9SPHN|nr:cyclic nucleotide-binding domain-containing protein [Erythrobacter crassostrea]MBV7258233.1 cyclic nucleotide-binding domain-containing protein [Erythrobacter crassostrea]
MPFDPSWLIHIGAALLLLAYAIRDELKLRLLIIVSTFIYIAYYYLAANPPLWDAIITSSLMVVINVIVLTQILLERTTFRMTEDEKALFDAFETLTPGQFRRIAKLAAWRTSGDTEGVILTREQEPSDSLFYIFEGNISVEKGGRRFRLPDGNFVGEVAFVLKRKTTATTIAPKGVRFVEWDSTALRNLSDKHPNLGNALNALLTRDLARKIGASYRPPDDAIPADSQAERLLESAQAAE